MLPLRDENRAKTFPVVNLALIAANLGIYLTVFLQDAVRQHAILRSYALVLYELLTFTKVVGGATEVPAVATLLTSLFLHGGWLHVLGNMWFLYIFGNNIEDRLGHWGYLAFYLVAGMVASLVHALSDVHSVVPTIGASGAVSGVLGAYLVCFPRAKIHTLMILFIFIKILRLPAVMFLGLWFLVQVLNSSMETTAGGGVAWYAHLGGFLWGAVLLLLLRWHGAFVPRSR